tara:strand:- start:1118 stop:1330 length:213 start_codon:yes stop_codon:yes gene_type:complete
MENIRMMTPIERHMLITLLERMDVPELRLDVSKPSNVRWLLRNLRINNNEAEGIDEAIQGLKTIARSQND